jgi:Tfp pilus assembly protein PilO
MGLDREQKKIISIWVVALCVFLVIWRGCYVPKKREVSALKAKVDVGKAEVDSVYNMIGREVVLKEAVGILKEEADRLGKKRIRQKDTALALRGLSDAAHKAGVRIISTKPQVAEAFTNKAGATPDYEGLVCMKLPVTITLEGNYIQIAHYIVLLENSARGIYTIEGFSMKKLREGSSTLKADLLVFIYCFG